MIIIGEKINGAIPRTAKAIAERDANYISNLAILQEKAGANYLDICAGTSPELEIDALRWLLKTVQNVTSLPICLDSPDPEALIETIADVQKPGILNSISAEHGKPEKLLPVLAENPGWSVMLLCSGDEGVAITAEEKITLATELVEKTLNFGIRESRIFIDPLVLAVPAVSEAAVEFYKVISHIKAKWPKVKVTAAISNISYGAPARTRLNQIFLAQALENGLDAGIIDPTNKEILGTVYASDLLLNKDKFSRQYNTAFRKNLFY